LSLIAIVLKQIIVLIDTSIAAFIAALIQFALYARSQVHAYVDAKSYLNVD